MTEAATARNNKTPYTNFEKHSNVYIASRCDCIQIGVLSESRQFVSFKTKTHLFVSDRTVCRIKAQKKSVKMCEKIHLMFDQKLKNKWMHAIERDAIKTEYGASV